MAETAWRPPEVIVDTTPIKFAALPGVLTKAQVILIGELHDRYDHHLTQLELICRLHARDPEIAIGVEFVQQPFQAVLDAYLSRRIGENELLRDSEYFERWGFDYRLYAPIVAFARTNSIPVIALNVPGETTAKVAREGLEALGPEERQFVPSHGLVADGQYRSRLKRVFDNHSGVATGEFEDFLNAQLLWDEGMAERAARYLYDHEATRLVIVAGNGHVAYRNAIAARIEARHPGKVNIVSQDQAGVSDADFELRSEELSLPPSGRLGVLLSTDETGVRIESFITDSAAREAGIETGDFIVSLDDEETRSYIDVKLILWRKLAGEPVTVGVARGGERLSFEVMLR